MRFLRALPWLIALSLIAPSSAWAVNEFEWVSVRTGNPAPSADFGSEDPTEVQEAQPGQVYYVDFPDSASPGETTKLIHTSGCDNGGTLKFYPDIAGAQFTAEAKIWTCPVPMQGTDISETRCSRVLADIDGGGVDNVTLNGDDGSDRDGDASLEQRHWISDIPFGDLFVEIDTVPTGGVTARAVLYCGV